jgi:hypothetical protein
MNKLTFILILLSVSLLYPGCKVKKQVETTPPVSSERTQLKYLPKQLHGTYLGMPYSEFKTQRMVVPEKNPGQMDFRIEYTESVRDGEINSITYYFDKDNKMPLYEYIIEYVSAVKMQTWVEKAYGEPNDGTEWKFDSGEGFMIKVWTFEKKVCVAGIIKDTEWND